MDISMQQFLKLCKSQCAVKYIHRIKNYYLNWA